jgi:hypothetical protein
MALQRTPIDEGAGWLETRPVPAGPADLVEAFDPDVAAVELAKTLEGLPALPSHVDREAIEAHTAKVWALSGAANAHRSPFWR